MVLEAMYFSFFSFSSHLVWQSFFLCAIGEEGIMGNKFMKLVCIFGPITPDELPLFLKKSLFLSLVPILLGGAEQFM